MKKGSLYELQLIDCNCNDCAFMVRDLSKRPKKGVPSPINYGYCDKFKKDVTFIPTHCQVDTQECFKHRRDETNN